MNNFSQLLGLSERDFSIFRLLNSFGPMPASTVATRLKMNRTTVFSALRRLVDKGMVFEIPKKGGSYFSSVEPEEILRQGEQRIETEERRFSIMKTMVKQLATEKGKTAGRPSVSFFEGENGIIALFQKTLTLEKDQQAFLTLEKIPANILAYLMNDYIREKKRNKVQSRVLIPESDRAQKYRSLDIEGNRETRFVPKNASFDTEVIFCGDVIALIDFYAPIGVLIESPPIASTLKTAFELLWSRAEG